MRHVASRVPSWASVLVASALVLSACSGDSDDASDTTVDDTAATEVTTEDGVAVSDALSPAEAVVAQFLRAIGEDDINSAYSTLSAPARIELGFRDGLESEWESLQAEFGDVVDADLDERLVPSLPFDLRAVVIGGDRVLVVRQEGGQLQVEPRAPLDPNAAVPVVVQVPGTSVEIRVDPVEGAVVRSATGDQGTGGGDVSAELIGLERGSRGQPVREWQGLLARWAEANGRTPPAVDGVFGRGTESITIDAESALGLPTDGVVDAELVQAILAEIS
ncbi:MAG: peptidoglycan-binding domain-containing protein [Actinomycetota bacterium]